MKDGKQTPTPFEVHEHVYISGPRMNRSSGGWPAGMGSHFFHSHADGSRAHEHPNTGPACFTIDKDEWAAATGLRGGGRKKYTKGPSGEQLPYVERAPGADHFEVIIDEESCRRWAEDHPNMTGAGAGPAARMQLAFDMTCTVTNIPGPGGKKAGRS